MPRQVWVSRAIGVSPRDSREPDGETQDLLSLADLLLRQIEKQQEVRDRWFYYYLLITAATVALSTSVLKVFEQSVAPQNLYRLAAVPLLLTGLIGICFFNIYLRQRRNYANHFAVLQATQRKLVERVMKAEYADFYPQGKPFQKQPKGADYFTLWVQIVLASAYLSGAATLIIASAPTISRFAWAVGLGLFVLFAALLNFARSAFEHRKV